MLGQNVISAKSGLVHYTMGKVYLGDKPITPKATDFPAMKDGDVLRTEAGRAEVLLSPGVFLRVPENSAVRMLNNALEDTRLELLAGSALLEIGELAKEQNLWLKIGATTLDFPKRGLFRVDFDPARVRAYDGSLVAITGEQPVTIKEGRQAMLAGVITPEKFNKELGDEFHRWAARRSGYIATVNLAAVRQMRDMNYPWNSSAWMWNPYFGSFTYIPRNGRYMSPFGWAYYTPRTYWEAYQPAQNTGWAAASGGGGFGGGGGGYRGAADMGGHSSSAVYSGPSSTATAGSAAATADTSSGRGSDGGGSRESSGGR
jgi:hypothetical protein